MKKIILLFLTVSFLLLGMSTVSAKTCYGDILFEDEGTAQLLDTAKECDAMFGDPEKPGELAYYLQKVLDIMKYAGIVLCIFLTIVDFAKALLGEDKDMYKALAKTAFNRLCYAVLLFFLPSIVKTLLTLIDVYGTCGIS